MFKKWKVRLFVKKSYVISSVEIRHNSFVFYVTFLRTSCRESISLGVTAGLVVDDEECPPWLRDCRPSIVGDTDGELDETSRALNGSCR